MKIAGHEIAVCSWSLQPSSMEDLVAKLRQLGLQKVQIALGDIAQLDAAKKRQELGILRAGGITCTSGMLAFPGEDYTTIDHIRRTGGFVPDDQWEARRRLAKDCASLAEELDIRLVSTHVGFVPAPGASGYEEICDRVRQVASDFALFGINLLMETGQERASELLDFLKDLAVPNVHINFDPANMILYGAGDPIEAIGILARHIRHVHAKDATASSKPGQAWGEEVAFGTGQVNPKAFLAALKKAGYSGPIAIEREAGKDRMGDVRFALEALKRAG